MPALTDLRDQACIVGIGETDYTRGTPKSALELALDASLGAIEDVGIQPGDIDAVILPNGAGSGGTAGDFCANLGLQDLHYTTSLQEMGVAANKLHAMLNDAKRRDDTVNNDERGAQT